MSRLHASESYRVDADRMGGISVTRVSDGAGVYFQPGDDANRFRDELETAEQRKGGIDELCGDYEAIFQPMKEYQP